MAVWAIHIMSTYRVAYDIIKVTVKYPLRTGRCVYLFIFDYFSLSSLFIYYLFSVHYFRVHFLIAFICFLFILFVVVTGDSPLVYEVMTPKACGCSDDPPYHGDNIP